MAMFSATDLDEAVEDLSMLEYFPREPGAQVAIMRLLAKMCPHRESLRWLVDTMTNRVGKWQGPMELRGVLCWKFRPSDGIEVSATIPGFTPADGEAKSLEAHGQLKTGGWIGAPEERKPSQLSRAGSTLRRFISSDGDAS